MTNSRSAAPPPFPRIILGTPGDDDINLADGHDPALAFDNIVFGLGGDDTVIGGTGNDWIWGSTAPAPPGTTWSNFFVAGGGDDVIVSYNSAGGVLDGEAGNDTIIASGATNMLIEGGEGDDWLWNLDGPTTARTASTLSGGNGNDVVVGGGHLYGDAGNDLLIATTSQTDAHGDDGNDTLYAGPGANAVYLAGGAGADVIVGNGHQTILDGGVHDGASDVLIGAPGEDDFWTYSNDQVPVADLVWNFELGTDKIHDVDGSDLSGGRATSMPSYLWTGPDGSTASFSGTLLTAANGHPLLFLPGENLTMAQLTAAGTFNTSPSSRQAAGYDASAGASADSAAASSVTAPSSNIVFGTLGDDNLTLPDGRNPALAYDNIAFGFGGSDTITGGTGNDWIWGSTGPLPFGTIWSDYFYGGPGDDVLIGYYSNGGVLDGGPGNDTIIATGCAKMTISGGDGDDSIWNLDGSGTFGSAGRFASTLSGGNGNDTLVGGGFLHGDAGNDVIIATTFFSRASGDDGNDTLYAGQGASAIQLDGGAGADVIVGNGLQSYLNGGAHDGASDVLIGGPGEDTFQTYSADPSPIADLAWNFELGTDKISDGDGSDLSQGGATYMPSYLWTAPDGSPASFSGTLLSAANGHPLLFFAGEDLTMAQLTAAHTFA